jgi:hypothetical protein
MDLTVISLCASLFDWARYKRTKGAVKLHLLIDHEGYLQMLSEQPLKIAKEDYAFFIPNPWTLAFHKILISQNRKVNDKKEKDLLQAAGLLRGIMKKPKMHRKALSYFDTLPEKWKKYTGNNIIEYVPDFFVS